jgi:glutathione S-transferase
MKLTFHHAPQSTCSQRVRFVLNAEGLRFGKRRLDPLADDQLKPAEKQ